MKGIENIEIVLDIHPIPLITELKELSIKGSAQSWGSLLSLCNHRHIKLFFVSELS